MPPKTKMNSEERIEKIISLMRSDDSVDAPQDAIIWARNLSRASLARQNVSPLRRLVAVLRADLLPNRPAFGERSAGSAAARQLLFEAGDIAIDVRVTSSGSDLTIRGQLLGEGCEDAELRLVSPAASYSTSADDLGEFVFEAVPNGSYSIEVVAGDAVITTDEIQF